MTAPWKPTRQQLLAAANTTLPDVIATDLRILFCGINPSLYSAAVGHHFAARAIASGRRCGVAGSPMAFGRRSTTAGCWRSGAA